MSDCVDIVQSSDPTQRRFCNIMAPIACNAVCSLDEFKFILLFLGGASESNVYSITYIHMHNNVDVYQNNKSSYRRNPETLTRLNEECLFRVIVHPLASAAFDTWDLGSLSKTDSCSLCTRCRSKLTPTQFNWWPHSYHLDVSLIKSFALSTRSIWSSPNLVSTQWQVQVPSGKRTIWPLLTTSEYPGSSRNSWFLSFHVDTVEDSILIEWVFSRCIVHSSNWVGICARWKIVRQKGTLARWINLPRCVHCRVFFLWFINILLVADFCRRMNSSS